MYDKYQTLLVHVHKLCTKMLWSDTGDEEAKENTTLQFNLKVKCIKNKNAPKNATDPDELYIHSKGNSVLMSPYGLILCLKFIFQGFKVICIHCHVQEQRKQIEPEDKIEQNLRGKKGIFLHMCNRRRCMAIKENGSLLIN